jgi:hypothetical protein
VCIDAFDAINNPVAFAMSSSKPTSSGMPAPLDRGTGFRFSGRGEIS